MFPFLILFKGSFFAVLFTSIPVFLHIISLLLIKFNANITGRFLFSITTAVSVYFAGAFIYIDDGTDGMAAKILITGTITLPFIVFKLKQWRIILLVILIDLFLISTFNFINKSLIFDDIHPNFDTVEFQVEDGMGSGNKLEDYGASDGGSWYSLEMAYHIVHK